jgi:hypothetical protein
MKTSDVCPCAGHNSGHSGHIADVCRARFPIGERAAHRAPGDAVGLGKLDRPSDAAHPCGVRFRRCADGVEVECILLAGHECAHAWGEP